MTLQETIQAERDRLAAEISAAEAALADKKSQLTQKLDELKTYETHFSAWLAEEAYAVKDRISAFFARLR